MQDAADKATPGRDTWGIAHLIDRAFLSARLLTGNIRQAEEATREAIESWNPESEPEETLFQKVLDAAARQHSEQDEAGSEASLPNELKVVLRLAPQLRRCFVLHILAGLPTQLCGPTAASAFRPGRPIHHRGASILGYCIMNR